MNADLLLGIAEILGRRRRRKARTAPMAPPVRRAVPRPPRRLRRPRRPKPVVTPLRKRKVRAAVRRLPTQTKVLLIRKIVKRRPDLRKKLQQAVLRKRLKERMTQPPPARSELPVPSVAPSYEPTQDPSDPPVLEQEARNPAEAVEEEMDEGALEEVAEEESDAETAVEELSDEEAESMAAEAADLTEPDEDEAEEAAEEEVEDIAEASEASGDDLMGYLVGALKRKRRVKSRTRRAVKAAVPTAKKLAKVTKGKIPVKRTLKGCALVAAAKAGDKRAKAAIVAIVARAKKGDKKAQKTVAQLKVCTKVLAKGRPKTRVSRPSKPPIRVPRPGDAMAKYRVPIRPIESGLRSYDSHQRGLAMIPGIARARYGQW